MSHVEVSNKQVKLGQVLQNLVITVGRCQALYVCVDSDANFDVTWQVKLGGNIFVQRSPETMGCIFASFL